MLDFLDIEVPDYGETELLSALTATKRRSALISKRRMRLSGAVTAGLVCAVIVSFVFAGSAGKQLSAHGGQLQWRLASSTTPSWDVLSIHLDGSSLNCVSTSKCFIEGWTGKRVVMEMTSDGGKTLQEVDIPASVDPPFTCISATTCAAIALGPDQRSVFVETTDGAKTWTSKTFPGQDTSTISCTSASSCIVLTRTSRARAVSMTTDDAGDIWRTSLLPRAVQGSDGFIPIWIRCSSNGYCSALGNAFVAGEAHGSFVTHGGASSPVTGTTLEGFAIYSSDGGRSWTTASLPAGFVMGYDAACSDDAHCMALGDTSSSTGDNSSDTGAVAVTSDGGLTWALSSSPGGDGDVTLNWVSCTSGATCWVTGLTPASRGSRSSPFLAETTDAGTSWSLAHLPARMTALGTVSCPAARTCFALGATAGPDRTGRLVLISNAS